MHTSLNTEKQTKPSYKKKGRRGKRPKAIRITNPTTIGQISQIPPKLMNSQVIFIP
jgi:hypothetical protein